MPGKERQMEPEPYSDQLIRVLRDLRARVIETEDVDASRLELSQTLISTQGIGVGWFAAKRPPPLPAAPGLALIADYARQYADAAGQEGELEGALQGISPDFSVAAIDNAIRVVERLA
jgi:hypothetical protein